MKKLYLFALAAMLFAACATDDTKDVQFADAPETLTVGFEEDTRIQLNEAQKTVWNEGDLVSVFYLSNANQKWQFQGKTGDRTGTLKRVMNVEATQEMSSTVVVYPYNENYYINPRTCNVRASLPATQHYLKDSYGLDGNILISASEYNQFSLKNVCGWLKLQLTGKGEKVKSITLKGNNGEQVAGQIYINSADATATLASEMGAADDNENGVGGNLVFDETILTEVVLDCGEGVTLGSEATAFYIALPPQTFTKGLTVNIIDTKGVTMTKTTDNSLVIERNTIQPMAAFEAKLSPANNEIWYTSSDGEIVTPYKTVFGVSIKSNVYENGKGVITFNGNVTLIGSQAFYERNNLTSVTIPDSVTSIESSAFAYCNSLTSITIPDSVTSIGNYAFDDCSSLASVYISNLSAWCKISYKISYANPLCYGAKLHLNGSEVADLTIPSDITEIKDYTFCGCTSLTSVTMHNRVTSIGDFAFWECSSLTSVNIPDSVTSIEYSAFLSCSNLTSVTIPDSVTSIRSQTFMHCSSLTSVTIPDSVTEIESKAFSNCNSLTSITIPDSVTSIEKNAFYSCSSLTSVYCKPTTPPRGGDSMFSGNASNRKIYVPASNDDSIINAYKSAYGWSTYKSYIEEYDFSAEL